jgi:tungstate transport system substrate-binding protein
MSEEKKDVPDEEPKKVTKGNDRSRLIESKGLWIALGAIIVIVIVLLSIYALMPKNEKTMFMATTTSTRDSGILDPLLIEFKSKSGIGVSYVAVGTGQALEYGKRGDADVLMVHSPSSEITFVNSGHGTHRYQFMYNQYKVVGPKSDPAGIANMTNVTAAFKKIFDTKSLFVTRGDESGTHMKEKDIWKKAGFNYWKDINLQNNSWYINVSGGMSQALTMANEKLAYTLTDEATYYAYQTQLDLVIHVYGDKNLFNQYSIIPVNQTMHSNVKYDYAMQLVCYLLSSDGQAFIGNFVVNGHKLFTPNASEKC